MNEEEEEPITIETLDEFLGEDDNSQEYIERCSDVYQEGVHVYYKREYADDMTYSSNKIVDSKSRVLHAEDLKEGYRGSEGSTLPCGDIFLVVVSFNLNTTRIDYNQPWKTSVEWSRI